MKRNFHPNYFVKNWLPLGALLSVYFLGRLLFQQWPFLKTAFIYPTGILVKLFYASGHYIDREWLYGFNETQFVLGESCSGTTFYCLLIAYFTFRIISHNTSLLYLLIAYPFAILANSIRVLSSIYAHNGLVAIDSTHLSSQIHVLTGATTFLICFLAIAFFIEKPEIDFKHGHD